MSIWDMLHSLWCLRNYCTRSTSSPEKETWWGKPMEANYLRDASSPIIVEGPRDWHWSRVQAAVEELRCARCPSRQLCKRGASSCPTCRNRTLSLSLLHFLFDHSLLNSLQVTLWRGKVFREHGLPATLIEHLIGTMLGAENITQLPGQQVLKAGMYSIVLHDGHLAMAHSDIVSMTTTW